MNYEKIHNQIIQRAKTRILEGYKEKHHVIPKCMGGNNDSNNLVDLTAREHFLIHWLLVEMYPKNLSLKYAFWRMCQGGNATQNRYVPSSRVYEYAKTQMCIAATNRTGWIHTDETKNKISKSHMGKIKSDETKIRISESTQGRIPWNKGISHNVNDIPEVKTKLYEKVYSKRAGKTFAEIYGEERSDEIRLKMSISSKTRKISQESLERIKNNLKLNRMSERIWVHNDIEAKMIINSELDSYINNGYKLGRGTNGSIRKRHH